MHFPSFNNLRILDIGPTAAWRHRDKFEDATAIALEALKSDDDAGFDDSDTESRG